MGGACLSIISAVLIWFLPESPRFLVGKKRYDEARQVFKFISKMNTGKEVTNAKFDVEHDFTKAFG